MSDPNYHAILVILDRSGSMADIRDEMVGALHKLLVEQSRLPGLTTVDVVEFDHEMLRTHQLADPSEVEIRLEPRGGTALYDAVGAALHDFALFFSRQPEHARPGQVQVVVVTDGQGTASVEHTPVTLEKLVRAREAVGWEFNFLGANLDVKEMAAELGTQRANTVAFEARPDSVRLAMAKTSRRMAQSRLSASRSPYSAESRTTDSSM